MTSTRRRFASLLAFCLCTVVAACGGDGIVLPDESRAAKIVIVSGDAQSGAVGATLSLPLVVKVTDALDRPVEGQAVAFTIDAGGGQVAPASVQTGSDGMASASWTLGSAAGQQRVQAQVSGAALLVKFNASAVSGAGTQLHLVSGDNQTAAVGSALADSLVVRVTDDLGNPVAGIGVQWAATGGGSISPVNVLSGADGTAAAERVLGNTSGAQGAQASSAGIASVTFTHTATPANPTALVLVSGNAQTGAVGAALPDSLVVRLVDDNGNGVGGKAISWVVGTGGGSVSPGTSTTNPNGFARTQWTLGPAAGANQLNAVFSGVPSVLFAATAQAGSATKLTFTQEPVTTSAGATITPAVRVAIQDASGNTVVSATDQVTIALGANPGAGTLSGTTTVAAINGVATFSNLSIDKTGSGYTLDASAVGLAGATSAAFDILTGSANRLVFLTGPTDRVVGEKFSPALQVQVQDAGGNPVVTASAVITLTSSITGTLSGTATATPVLGTATFSNLAISKAGLGYTLTALSSGVTSQTSAAFDVSPASTTTAIVSKSPTGTSVTGQSVTFNYDVNVVLPGAGTLTGTVTVSDGTQSCTGSISAGSGTGSCAIPFASAGSRSVTATYSGDANFTTSSSASVSHTVNKANTSLIISSAEPNPSLINESVTVQWTVAATGAGAGTPTGNVTVTASGSTGCTETVGTGGCTLVFTTNGTPTITASYAGDADFNGSSDNEPHAVQGETSTAVVTSGSPSTFGDDVTFSAHVTAETGTGNPGGQVRFFDGATQIGQDNVNGSGNASMHLATLAVGSHSITAVYQGSTTFAASMSAVLTQVVDPGNGAPTALADGYTVNEDGSLTPNAAEGVLANDSDPDSDPLSAIQISAPTHAQTFSLNSDGSFSYVPDADFNGQDSFTYQAADASHTSSTVTVTITVTAVNDAPSFTSSGDVTVNAAGGPVSQAWATGSPGPSDESGQALVYTTSVDLPGSLLFSVQPSVAPDGTLSFTPNGVPGTATVTVHVQDDGGTANGGVDTSGDQWFTITLN